MSEFLRCGGIGLALLLAGASAGAAPVPGEAGKALDAATQAQIKALLVERRDVLRKGMKGIETAFLAGRGALTEMGKTSRLLLEAELALAEKGEQRIGAHRAHFDSMKKMEHVMKGRHEAGAIPLGEYQLARAARIEAEIGWLRAGGKRKKEK